MEFTVEVVAITPEMAESWLEKNVSHNRRVSMRLIDKYALAMERGKWKLTHQGIAFDQEGNLVDGQHRLFAIFKSRKTIRMLVFRGVDPETFAVVDAGRNRNHGDIVDIVTKLPNARTVAAVLKLVYCYDTTSRPWPTGLIDNERVADLAADKALEVHELLPQARMAARRLGGTQAGFGAAFFLVQRWAEKNGKVDLMNDWIEGLITGVGLETGDARLALESWLKGAGVKLRPSLRAEVALMLTLRAFVAHLRGEKLGKLMVNDPGYYEFRLPEE